MTGFRIRYTVLGGHVHCVLSATDAAGETWARCGDFVVQRGREFTAMVEAMRGVQFVAEDAADPTGAMRDD